MDLPARTLLQRIELVTDRLRALGVRVDASTRFGQVARAASRLKSDPQILRVPHPDLPMMAYAVQDAFELELILLHLWKCGVPPDQEERRRRLCLDDPLPKTTPGKTQGRDLQFEMVVEAKCVAGGLDAVADETTDVRCMLAGRSFGVACKRCQTEDSTVRACEKGSEQILASGAPGVLAIDVSQVVNPGFRFLQIQDHYLAALRIRQGIEDLLRRIGGRVLGVVDRTRVARAYFFVHWLRESRPFLVELDGVSMTFKTQRGDEVLHRKSLLQFDRGLLGGTPGLQGFVPPLR
jgi:hypothetical protein